LRARPPRLAERLLAACLPPGYRRDGVLGDLHEEFLRTAEERGTGAARRWYRRQALSVGPQQVLQRLRQRFPRVFPDAHGALPRHQHRARDPLSLPANGGHHDRGKRDSSMMDFITDLRIGLRGLHRQPGFTAVVIATLAVAIGANGTIFSLVERVLLQPLPYPDPGRVVQVWGSNQGRDVLRWGTSLHDFEDWRARSETLSAIGVYNLGAANLQYGEIPERVTYAQVSPSVFDVLGTAPALGRTLREEENLPGNDGVAVVSHDFWMSVLGGSEGVIGTSVVLDGTPLQIVGIMPENFYFPSRTTRLWKPFGMRPDDSGDRGGRWVSAVGRLAPGATIDSAQAEMSAIGAALADEYPETNEGFGVFLEPRGSSVVRNSRPIVLVAWAVVALVLLIACANVANLVLSRATARAREMAVRASLGAGRGRLVRQLLTESLLLGIAGGAAGLLLAAWLTSLLRGLQSSGIARLDQVAVTWPVVAYAVALSLLTALLFGVAPALRASQLDLSHRLKDGGAGGSGRRGARELLVAAQLALSVIVLIGTALLLRTFWNLAQVDVGFGIENRVEARLSPSKREVPERPQVVVLYDGIAEQLRGLPAVELVGGINTLPLVGSNTWRTSIFADGQPLEADGSRPSVGYRVITGDYFEVLDIDLVAGRYLDARDVDGAQPVVVLSRSAAEAIWPQQDPLERELWLVPEDQPEHKRYHVAGIVEDVVDDSLTRTPMPLLYFTLPQAQWGHFQDWGFSFVVRSATDAGALVEPVRDAIEQVSAGLPVFDVQTLRDRFASALAPSRFNLAIIGVLGAVALALASLGVYGVMGFMVAQRRREIGTRVALGADRNEVMRLVVGRGLGLAVAGVVAGVLGAYAAHGVVESLLFGVESTDPASYAGIAVILLAVSFVATLIPARRAAAIDPIVCLREE